MTTATAKAQVSFLLPANLLAQLERLAREHDRSISGEIRYAVRQHLDAHRKGPLA